MSILSISLISVLGISLVSFIGVILLVFRDEIINKILIVLVAFSAGTLMGGAFFHLLPETLKTNNKPLQIFSYLLIGFSCFFIIERILRWRHCHQRKCQTHPHLGYINLIGDGVHNAIDGIIIFSAFSVGPQLGIPIVLSILFHEIPQEIGDFGVLLYSGFKKIKALFFNFISALFSFAGVFLGFVLLNQTDKLINFLLPFAAGGFIYIAASDLIPELHKEKEIPRSLISFITFAVALILMLLAKIFTD